jgi:hypothetical protein
LKNWNVPALLLVTFSFLVTSCKLPAPSTPQPTVSKPEAVFTAAAQTAEARSIAKSSQTPAPEALLETAIAPSPTATELMPTEEISATVALTGTEGAPPSGATNGDKAEFAQDITIPDGTVFSPGEEFEKTWRLKNTGTTTWTTDYSLIFIDGELMGAPVSVPMPQEVKPDDLVDITVKMVAPDKPGSYRSYWELRNTDGKIFGFGSNSDASIWVDITVQGSVAKGGPTPTNTPENVAVGSTSLSVN